MTESLAVCYSASDASPTNDRDQKDAGQPNTPPSGLDPSALPFTYNTFLEQEQF
jgi:hypothetical protein